MSLLKIFQKKQMSLEQKEERAVRDLFELFGREFTPQVKKEILDIVRQDLDVYGWAESGQNTIFMRAVETKDFEIVSEMLSRGGEMDRQNNNGETPLMVASSGGSMDIVEALIKHGADSKLKNKSDQTAAGIATDKNHADIADYLHIVSKHGSMRQYNKQKALEKTLDEIENGLKKPIPRKRFGGFKRP